MNEYLPIRVGTNFHAPSIFILVYKMWVIDLNLVSQHMKMHQNMAFAWTNSKFSGDEDAPPHTSAPRRLRHFALPRNEIYV